jgi:hypothetical protein
LLSGTIVPQCVFMNGVRNASRNFVLLRLRSSINFPNMRRDVVEASVVIRSHSEDPRILSTLFPIFSP